MDTTAVALSVGIPCLSIALTLAYVALYILYESAYGHNREVAKALSDERIRDRLVLAFLETRIKQCVAQIVHTKIEISRNLASSVACRRAIVEHRIMIAALNDLGKLSYHKRKRVHTLPYHSPVRAA